MTEFISQFPHFRNKHTETQALGLALDEYKQVYYLSTAGPGTACKGIWGSLVGNRSQLDCLPWGYTIRGVKGIKTVYQSLPNSNFQHMVSLYKSEELIVVCDPAAATLNDELDLDVEEQREKMLKSHRDYVIDRFLAYMTAATDVPVLPHWGHVVWWYGLKEGGMKKLECFGDCLGAYYIYKDFDWLDLVQRLLDEEQITFDEIPF